MNVRSIVVCFALGFLTPMAQADQNLKSTRTTTKMNVSWKNQTSSPITVSWIDFDGNESTNPLTLSTQGSTALVAGTTFPGHFFKATSAGRSFYCLTPYSSTNEYEMQPFAPVQGLYAQGMTYKSTFYEGKYETLNIGNYFAQGKGVAWKHTFKRRDTGKEGVEYLTELERGPKSVILQNPITRMEVKITALGRDESGGNASRSDVHVRSNKQSSWQNNGVGQLIQVTF